MEKFWGRFFLFLEYNKFSNRKEEVIKNEKTKFSLYDYDFINYSCM